MTQILYQPDVHRRLASEILQVDAMCIVDIDVMHCVSLHLLYGSTLYAGGKVRPQMSSPLHLSASLFAVLMSILGIVLTGCARLPETTRVLHESDRVVIKLETDLDVPSSTQTNPADISKEQLTSLLRGFSVLRAESRVSIPLLAGDAPPSKLFREAELDALVPVLREAIRNVGFSERVRFEVLSPGRNPRYWRDVTGGWVKVRRSLFSSACRLLPRGAAGPQGRRLLSQLSHSVDSRSGLRDLF